MSINMTQGLEHTLGERFEVGTLVGDKYQLLRKAGEGAMGSVWVAANTALEANVAIKVLRPEMRSPAIAERLLREARAAAKLSHPGIVRVFDLGKTAEGTPYIVMELLEGEALRDVLCREPQLSPETAVAILLPVASAMHAAHERGVVHRDLKPDNVMLADQGDGRIQPKVVDFGIAKVTWTEPESGSTGAAVIGTPQYMPPEQALGQGHVDHRAEIWALCTMLYEAIAGETPYAGEQGFGTLRAIIQDPVRSDAAKLTVAYRGYLRDLYPDHEINLYIRLNGSDAFLPASAGAHGDAYVLVSNAPRDCRWCSPPPDASGQRICGGAPLPPTSSGTWVCNEPTATEEDLFLWAYDHSGHMNAWDIEVAAESHGAWDSNLGSNYAARFEARSSCF